MSPVKEPMLQELQAFWQEEDGAGVVEVLLILVVIDTIQQPIILC